MSKIVTINEIKEKFQTYGYVVLDDIYKGCKGKLNIVDDIGYKYYVYPDAVNKKTPNLAPFHSRNPYTINNINIYLKNRFGDRFRCISEIYIDKKTRLKFECKNCGSIFESSWGNINRCGETRNGLVCPKCGGHNESLHALILKQIFLHEYPDTSIEDRSCISPLTNKVMPTDIVNHARKIAIEIQSEYHDNNYSKIKDTIKKDYWENLDYNFYSPDIRNFTIIEMIKIFFPEFNEIPSYVDFNYSNKLNIPLIQSMINTGTLVTDIAKSINIDKHRIYDALHSGKLYYPPNYKIGNQISVVQLSCTGEYLNVFDSISDASRQTGISDRSLSNALRNARTYCKGYHWIKTEDYKNNNYTLKYRQTSNIKESVETATA